MVLPNTECGTACRVIDPVEHVHQEQGVPEEIGYPVQTVLHQGTRKIVHHVLGGFPEVCSHPCEWLVATLGVLDDEYGVADAMLTHTVEHPSRAVPRFHKTVSAPRLVTLKLL